MKTIKILLSLVMIILIVNIASANLCNTIVNSNEAVESYTTTIKTPIMEDKLITKTINDVAKYKTDVASFKIAYENYYKSLEVYNELEDKSKAIKPSSPIYPIMTKKDIVSTIKVQKVIEKTKYRFITKFPFIESYTIKVSQYTEKQETISRIKKGYFLDEDTGSFYKKENC